MMKTSSHVLSLIRDAKATTEEALAQFDTLQPVGLDFMLGRWQGSEIDTSHPMNGLLAVSSWYGKEFVDPDHVHPLLCLDYRNNVIKVAPHPMAMGLVLNMPMLKNKAMKPLLTLTSALLKTEQSKARLRMMEYRGKVSATMIYDDLPINDVFRKVDEDTVLGVMDFKDAPEPFFFVLKRVLKRCSVTG